ncbi:MAG: response regulator transcription factor [Firmicutes bacterium]|nr:response regulator transcription factor [Bacillota bacterium]
MAKLLIVDDEKNIRELLKEYLSISNYTISEAADGLEALKLIEQEAFDLIILDVMMPKVDGWTVCREIRLKNRTPIIMLTARGEEYDKLLGFELGIDDYVVKPFSPKELTARIKAVLARSAPVEKHPSSFVYDGLKLDIDARTLTRDGERISLSPKEYDLLQFFMENPSRAFSREQLLTSVWGYDFYGDDRTVDSHIKSLRERLGRYRSWIATVWGLGYKFEPIPLEEVTR